MAATVGPLAAIASHPENGSAQGATLLLQDLAAQDVPGAVEALAQLVQRGGSGGSE